MPKTKTKPVLGYVTPMRAYLSVDRIYIHAASGRVADALAKHYERVLICARVMHGSPPAPTDSPLEAANVEVIAQPAWRDSLGSLPHFFGIVRAYIRTSRRSDLLLVRGMCPYIAILYLCAFLFRRPICHWIVGNPVALLRTCKRRGRLFDTLAVLYALQDRFASRIGRWLTNGAFVCNGRELADIYRSPRTIATVSSTVRECEFFPRADTCQRDTVRIIFVGYVRPEKGIEYLLHAVSRLEGNLLWELRLVGGDDEFPEYRRRLNRIAAAQGIRERVHWDGYASYGKSICDRMRASDILVLPSLSEGTPHVLVEARANGLPCISTKVGGVPITVTDGYDALLVPPKNSDAIARAIERIVSDKALRRTLIRNGFTAARAQTLECFVALLQTQLDSTSGKADVPILQE